MHGRCQEVPDISLVSFASSVLFFPGHWDWHCPVTALCLNRTVLWLPRQHASYHVYQEKPVIFLTYNISFSVWTTDWYVPACFQNWQKCVFLCPCTESRELCISHTALCCSFSSSISLCQWTWKWVWGTSFLAKGSEFDGDFAESH